ncbi:hypothetical protein JOM56_011431 [Amanita muscaria]
MAVPAKAVLDMCKEVDKRMWRSMVLLRQFKGVPAEVIQKAEGKQYPWERYYDLQPPHIGELLGIPNAGSSAQTTTFPSFRTIQVLVNDPTMFEYDHTKLQEWLAKLSSGVAVITVGGLIIRSRSWKVSYREAVSRFSKRLSNLPCHHLEAQVDQLIPPLRLMRSPPHRILYEVLRITVAGCRRRTLDVKSGRKKQRGRGLEEMGIRHLPAIPFIEPAPCRYRDGLTFDPLIMPAAAKRMSRFRRDRDSARVRDI